MTDRTRGASSCRIYQRRGTTCGSVATAWSTRRSHEPEPGEDLSLTVTIAATPKEAARVYPANYWYSLLEVPPASDFPGTGPGGNGIGTTMRTQADWIDRLKDGCQLCHQLGNLATREMPMLDVADFDSTVDAVAAPNSSRWGRSGYGRRDQPVGPGARSRALRRLDRSDPGWRNAARTTTPAGQGTQRRPDHVGLGPPARDGARRGLDRQAQPDDQCERADLRRRWGRARHHGPPREPLGPHEADDPRRAAAQQRLVSGLLNRGPVSLLGQRA